ncbi:ion transporter [Thiomicrospira sp.]|uniref:ion transporter n=1 Tax=Thiomicrospira sp. TaxID=935 RepID=UPI0025EDC493|nr:ion transporter [Thiomicrospira sp.]
MAIRDNKAFEWFVISVIVLSSVVIGAKTYDISPNVLNLLAFLDVTVTLFFLLEILVRMAAERRFWDFFKKGWNIFDFTIVVVSLIPINDSEYALLARMLRLFRVLRLISFIPEMRVLVNALLIAIPRIGYVALLMFVIFYLYAVVGSFIFAPINEFLWGDLGAALLTLFRVATFEDWTDVMYETMEVYPYSWIYYLTFIFMSTFIFLNMMIGIVVSVLDEEHRKSMDKGLHESLDEEAKSIEDLHHEVSDLHRKLDQLLQQTDPKKSS